jgi:transposase InsO family protein
VLARQRYLIHDRGAVFTEKFQSILAAVDVETLKLPARALNLNAHLERRNRGIREECLDHLILFSEASLREVVGEYVAHFHRKCPHQGLGNKIIEPEFEPLNRAGEIQCRKRLGGLLKYYYLEAA